MSGRKRANVHWRQRTDPLFAEVAEVFGTTTDLVMTAVVMPKDPGAVYAIVTPNYGVGDRTAIKALLRRDDAGVLQVVEREEDRHLLDRMEADIKERMGRRFGPPR